jgi:hypothetical protein
MQRLHASGSPSSGSSLSRDARLMLPGASPRSDPRRSTSETSPGALPLLDQVEPVAGVAPDSDDGRRPPARQPVHPRPRYLPARCKIRGRQQPPAITARACKAIRPPAARCRRDQSCLRCRWHPRQAVGLRPDASRAPHFTSGRTGLTEDKSDSQVRARAHAAGGIAEGAPSSMPASAGRSGVSSRSARWGMLSLLLRSRRLADSHHAARRPTESGSGRRLSPPVMSPLPGMDRNSQLVAAAFSRMRERHGLRSRAAGRMLVVRCDSELHFDGGARSIAPSDSPATT